MVVAMLEWVPSNISFSNEGFELRKFDDLQINIQIILEQVAMKHAPRLLFERGLDLSQTLTECSSGQFDKIEKKASNFAAEICRSK